jgi:3-methyladenine DNA glycosylase/8-oxoguanine DNA glycosylase
MSGVVIDVTGDPEGSMIVTARNCAGSINEGGLERRAPATPGPATRADTAMSAAIATMSLIRTIAASPYPNIGKRVRSNQGSFCNGCVAYSACMLPDDAFQTAPLERSIDLLGPLNLRLTLGLHGRGRFDPALRFEVSGSAWRATRTPDGPVTLFIELEAGGTRVRARAWGPGAPHALGTVDALLGLDDDPSALVPRHPVVAEAVRRFRGLRIGWTGNVMEALVPAILEQKVTGTEASRAYRGIIARWGEDAPGPPGLRVPPAATTLASLPYHAFHPVGLERRRAELIRAVAREAPRLERLAATAAGPGGDPEPAYRVLRAFAGIGPWTAAEVGARAFGDPDAVSVGDAHVPNTVSWALAGEPRGTDERMLELLEPYRGQRGRVIRLLEASGVEAPRYGPRMAPRRIERL